MKKLMRKFMDLLQMTQAFYHNHGEELKMLLRLMAVKADSDGILQESQKLQLRRPSLKEKREILETNKSMKKFMDSLLMIRAFFHNHGEEHQTLLRLMDLKVDSDGM